MYVPYLEYSSIQSDANESDENAHIYYIIICVYSRHCSKKIIDAYLYNTNILASIEIKINIHFNEF